MTNDRIEWLSINQTAAEFGCSRSVIERACEDGTILSYQFGTRGLVRIPKWWVDKELKRFREGKSVGEVSETELIEEGRRIARALAAAERVGAL